VEKGGEGAAYNGFKKRRGVKVHAAVTVEGLPVSLVIGAGNEHDSRRFIKVLEGIGIMTGRRGRPMTRPHKVVADAAYDGEKIRRYLRRRGIRSIIPTNRRTGRKQSGGPTRFDEPTYRNRACVERFFGWLKMGFRRLTVRYERLDVVFTGLLCIACILMYWRRIRERVLKQAHYKEFSGVCNDSRCFSVTTISRYNYTIKHRSYWQVNNTYYISTKNFVDYLFFVIGCTLNDNSTFIE